MEAKGRLLNLGGFHHLTAITAHARENLAFYTNVLGLRLVKKTVNQDDVFAYHLFYADGKASPGTDITFFDWPPRMTRERRGTNSIVRTGLRVPGFDGLEWWTRRFETLNVKHDPAVERGGRLTIDFEDPEGQRLGLAAEESSVGSNPWDKSPVPPEHQILGLGPIAISVANFAKTDRVLREVMAMNPARDFALPNDGGKIVQVYSISDGALAGGGLSKELHVIDDPDSAPARAGAGGAHHVAFRTPNIEEYDAWNNRLADAHIPTSGPVDRFYFRSLISANPAASSSKSRRTGPASRRMKRSNTLANDYPCHRFSNRGDKRSKPASSRYSGQR